MILNTPTVKYTHTHTHGHINTHTHILVCCLKGWGLRGFTEDKKIRSKSFLPSGDGLSLCGFKLQIPFCKHALMSPLPHIPPPDLHPSTITTLFLPLPLMLPLLAQLNIKLKRGSALMSVDSPGPPGEAELHSLRWASPTERTEGERTEEDTRDTVVGKIILWAGAPVPPHLHTCQSILAPNLA